MSKKKKTKMDKNTKQTEERLLALEYYQLPFKFLHERYLKNVDGAVRRARIEIKRKYESKIATGLDQVLIGDDAFILLRGFLDELEEIMSQLLKKHSTFFWMHLYRRVGIGHISQAFEKSDASTLASVRQTVE